MVTQEIQNTVNQSVHSFFCSGQIWYEYNTKVSYGMDAIWLGLEAELKISNYSPIIRQYAVFFDCLLPKSPFQSPEEGWYSKKEQIIYQSFNLDYKQVEAVLQEELLAIMAQKYLEGIPKIKTFWGMKSTPFDTDTFYQDAKNVFEKKGFLPPK